MKKLIVPCLLILIATGFAYSQSSDIASNIKTAASQNGMSYNTDGTVVVQVNVEVIQNFYAVYDSIEVINWASLINSYDNSSLAALSEVYTEYPETYANAEEVKAAYEAKIRVIQVALSENSDVEYQVAQVSSLNK
jgi:hypothetical protein